MLKLENSIRGLSFSRVAFDLTIQATKLFSAKVIHSGGKVGFRFPTIPFLYPEYKIRNISIFYSLEFYFLQRTGKGIYIFTSFPLFGVKIRGKI